jgi:hypothetical protein
VLSPPPGPAPSVHVSAALRRSRRRLTASLLTVTFALGVVLPGASPVGAPVRVVWADEPASNGVVVVALPGATDAAWPIARALYGRFGMLPPGLTDAEARTLAGETVPVPVLDAPPATSAPATPTAKAASVPTATNPSRERLAHLTRLREEVEKPATRHEALADLVRITHARGAVIVGAAAGVTITRTYSAETKLIADALTSPSENVDIDKIAAEARTKTAAKTEANSFLRSPWTWVAVGAGALLGTVLYLTTRSSSTSDTVPLRLQTDR